MERLLEHLRKFDALRDADGDDSADQVAVRTLPSNPPEYAPKDFIVSLPDYLQAALADAGIERLYKHQAEAIVLARQGEDIVLESPTASGKTLCFTIPMLDILIRNPNSHALMIHPMKALSNDQRRQFEQLTKRFDGSNGRKIESWVYDGDTDEADSPQRGFVTHASNSTKKLLRDNPTALLLTNPEMLHLSFLQWSESWNPAFFKNLRLLVIDEIHEYRGYFGTNMALLIRRFLSRLHDLGARPQLILASATCRNPLEHAKRLTGRDFTLVRTPSGFRPERHFAFINPAIPDFKFHDIFLLRIARAGLACLDADLSTIVFCPSRKFTERASILAKRDAEQFGLDPSQIRPYRSGYKADDRREIEDGLRSGKYKLVFSTNALEIGIDVGRLDVCILAGFPDNVMSAWQRIGRAGRSFDKTAYVLFYGLNDAINQFFVENIDAFMSKPLDELMIGVDNEELIKKHVPYLLHETEWNLNNKHKLIVGDSLFESAHSAAKGSKPMKGGRGPNYRKLSIRGGSGSTSKLIYHEKEIGSLSDVYLFREAYIGAIMNHDGKSYRVRAHGAGEVELEDAESYLRTEGKFYTRILQPDVILGIRFRESISLTYGKTTIYENFSGYLLLDDRSGRILEDVPGEAALPRKVRAFFINFDSIDAMGVDEFEQGLRVLEQFIRIGAAFVIPCDRHDIGTWTNLKIPNRAVLLYETVPGGIGIAEKMLDVWRDVVEKGIEIASACKCKHGCARCIHPPRYRPKQAGELRKEIGLRFASRLLSFTSVEHDEMFDPDLHAWRPRTRPDDVTKLLKTTAR